MNRVLALMTAALLLGLPLLRAAAAFEHVACPMHEHHEEKPKRLPCHDAGVSHEPQAPRVENARPAGVPVYSAGACRCGAGDLLSSVARDPSVPARGARLAHVVRDSAWAPAPTDSASRVLDPPEPPPPMSRS